MKKDFSILSVQWSEMDKILFLQFKRGVDKAGKSSRKNLIVIDAPFDSSANIYRSCSSSLEPEDVIDLGAPRGCRLRANRTAAASRTAPALYTPNPRLRFTHIIFVIRYERREIRSRSAVFIYSRPKEEGKYHLAQWRAQSLKLGYPGPAAGHKKRLKTRSPEGRRKRRGRDRKKFTKPVPNSRLYRPAPAQPPPPSPQPRGSWPAPAPPARGLDTASRAALRLLQDRHLRPPSASPLRGSPLPPSPSATVANALKARRLVVTLPAADSGDAPRYKPTSEHFRLRARPSLGSGVSTPPAARRAGSMAATNKHSTSPDCSDGNDASSAPSEFLAEFLSAIMRRQYAEALKYCQLILQYEPHNSTARGFYPLLQHKVTAHANTHRKAQKKDETSSESEDTSPKKGGLSSAHMQKLQKPVDLDAETEGSAEASGSVEEEMEQGADGSGSACSSLELDSEPSPASPSPRTPHTPRLSPRDTDPADTSDPTDPSDSASWRWESGGSHSERDDNGNHPAPLAHSHTHYQGGVDDTDVENDNAVLPSHSHLKSESVSSLQRLRAQFTCSIK